MKQIFILIFALFTVLSCRVSKKTSSEIQHYKNLIDSLQTVKNRILKDTIIKTEYDVIIDEVETIVEVEVDCDSLGRVKPIKYNSKSGHSYTEVIIKNNTLFIKTKTDSIIQHFESFYRSKYVKDSINLRRSILRDEVLRDVKSSEIVKKRFPWIGLSAGLIVLFFLILKFTPWFNSFLKL